MFNSGRLFWRQLVVATRDSKPLFFAFMGVCIAVPWAVAEALIWASNRNNDMLHEELLRRPNANSLAITKANKERLQELLDDIKLKRDINDRYAAALRGETMTGPPEARVVGRGGTTLPRAATPLLQTPPAEQPQSLKQQEVPGTKPQLIKQES